MKPMKLLIKSVGGKDRVQLHLLGAGTTRVQIGTKVEVQEPEAGWELELLLNLVLQIGVIKVIVKK